MRLAMPFRGWEGVICEVLGNRSERVEPEFLGKWCAFERGVEVRSQGPKEVASGFCRYTWFVSNLWTSDDVVEFQRGGSCATSRGGSECGGHTRYDIAP